jgi:hypothetical protein
MPSDGTTAATHQLQAMAAPASYRFIMAFPASIALHHASSTGGQSRSTLSILVGISAEPEPRCENASAYPKCGLKQAKEEAWEGQSSLTGTGMAVRVAGRADKERFRVQKWAERENHRMGESQGSTTITVGGPSAWRLTSVSAAGPAPVE